MEHYALLNGSYTHETLYDLKPVRAEGAYLYSQENRKYLDLRSGLWNISLGYDKKLYQKVSDKFTQILENKLSYLDIHSFRHNSYEEVAQKLLAITGNAFKRVIYTNSGSESTELALKIAAYTNKKATKNRILAFKDSYHGTFFGGVSVSGIDQGLNTLFYPKYGEVTFIDFPKNREDEERILTALAKNAGWYDVMVIEPVLASAGVYYTSEAFFNKLLKLLRENQVITVFDEVATGFFKTGLPFFFNHLSEVPDLICLSKAINNGITPFGCVCVAEELDYRLQKSTSIKEHFSTQNGNLLGMVSAEVTLDYYLKEKSSLENRVTWISETVRNIFDAQGVIYRNIGAMISVRTIPGYAAQLVKELEKLGILVYLYANNGEEGLSIMPPLTINEVSLEKALTMIGKKVVKYQ